MREKTLYARLAWTGMRKNRRLYLPYLLSCAGMVLMFYILMGLSGSEVLGHMSGGTSSAIILRLGTVVIAVFALIFLFYTHSFLIRRREREFGLYNVLGMGKGQHRPHSAVGDGHHLWPDHGDGTASGHGTV